MFHVFSSVTSLGTKDCRIANGSLVLNRMSVDLPGSSDRYPVTAGFEHPRLVFWFLNCCNSISTPQWCHCRLSSTAFHVPMTMVGHPGLILALFLVVRVFSSPAWWDCQASSALSHQYYPWICHPLTPPRFGFSSSVWFYNVNDSL